MDLCSLRQLEGGLYVLIKKLVDATFLLNHSGLLEQRLVHSNEYANQLLG